MRYKKRSLRKYIGLRIHGTSDKQKNLTTLQGVYAMRNARFNAYNT